MVFGQFEFNSLATAIFFLCLLFFYCFGFCPRDFSFVLLGSLTNLFDAKERLQQSNRFASLKNRPGFSHLQSGIILKFSLQSLRFSLTFKCLYFGFGICFLCRVFPYMDIEENLLMCNPLFENDSSKRILIRNVA